MATNAQIDLFTDAALRDPFPAMAALRAQGPLVRYRFPIIGKVWLATTQEMAAHVLKHPGDFPIRSDEGKIAGMQWWMPPVFKALAVNMLTFDDPDHARLRGIVDEAFHRRPVLAMAPRIRAMADELAAGLFAQGEPADLVQRFCRRLPLKAICELLGLPEGDHELFIGWAARATDISSAMFLFRMVPALRKIRKYILHRVQVAKADGHAGLIGELVQAQRAGAPVNDQEVVSTIFLLLMAGQETTTHLISGAAHLCLMQPDLREIVTVDEKTGNLAVEEFLRFVSAVQVSKPRHVARDMVLEGVALKAGERVMACLASANSDPSANEAPERLDPHRHPNRHLAFGAGPHFCLGHQLARIEAREGLKALFVKWPHLRLAIAPEQIRWRRRAGLRAILEMPVAAQ